MYYRDINSGYMPLLFLYLLLCCFLCKFSIILFFSNFAEELKIN